MSYYSICTNGAVPYAVHFSGVMLISFNSNNFNFINFPTYSYYISMVDIMQANVNFYAFLIIRIFWLPWERKQKSRISNFPVDSILKPFESVELSESLMMHSSARYTALEIESTTIERRAASGGWRILKSQQLVKFYCSFDHYFPQNLLT